LKTAVSVVKETFVASVYGMAFVPTVSIIELRAVAIVNELPRISTVSTIEVPVLAHRTAPEFAIGCDSGG